jgi:hypothetical protein
MSTPPSTPVSVDLTTTEPKKGGLTVQNIVKIIVVCIIIYVVYAVFSIFRGISKDPAFKNLGEAFNNTTAALAWASSHWELLLAAFLIAPAVPKAFQWAADKLATVEKKGVDQKVKEKLVDMIDYKVKSEQAVDASLSKEVQDAAKVGEEKAVDRFESGSEEDKKAAEEIGAEPGIDIPPIPERALLKAKALKQVQNAFLARTTGPVWQSGYPVA